MPYHECQNCGKRLCKVYVINREILVVASHTIGKLWKAYVGVVAGRDHQAEWPEVLHTGDTLDERLAKFLFPKFAQFPYDR